MRIVKADPKLAEKARRAKEKKQSAQLKKDKALKTFRKSRAFPYVKQMIKELMEECYVEKMLDSEDKIAKSSDNELRQLMIGAVLTRKKLKKLLHNLTASE